MHLVRPIGQPIGAAIVFSAAVGLSACAVRAYPPTIGGYATVYADDVPPDVYSYPHTSYGGGYAYLVGDRWYYPTGRGWVVLRDEPGELRDYRTHEVLRAPPAYSAPYRGEERYPREAPRQYAPPAQYGYPPPAVRVR